MHDTFFERANRSFILGGHVLEQHAAGTCPRPDGGACPICDGGLAACLACGKAEGDLAEVCPAPGGVELARLRKIEAIAQTMVIEQGQAGVMFREGMLWAQLRDALKVGAS